MRIQELTIYGYGKFENKTISFAGSFQVIYGENEAGKSTIMSFIHSIFFGFPTKQQGVNRYEPKAGTKYGGNIVVHTKEHGRLKIERLPGKAVGDVTVFMEDGTARDELFLNKLLEGLDKNTYQSIFSFNIHGLQDIKKLSGDQIGKFMFFSSMYGSDALYQMENKLTKEQDLLFKPNGKKPILNEALTQLKEKNEQVIEAKQKISSYQQLLHSKDTIEQKIEEIESKKNTLVKKIKQSEKLEIILPLLREKEWGIQQLNTLSDSSDFPENGLSKLEQLSTSLQPLNAQLHSYQVKRQQLEEKDLELKVREEVINSSEEILFLKENLQMYRERKEKRNDRAQKIASIQQEINLCKQRLLPHLTESEITHIHATLPLKEELRTQVSHYQQLKQKRQLLDDQFLRTKEALEESEWKANELKGKLLTEVERLQLEKEEQNAGTSINLDQLQEEEQQLSNEIEHRKAVNFQHRKSRLMMLSLIALIFVTGMGWSLVEQLWPLSGILLITLGFVLFQVKVALKQDEPLIEHLQKRKISLQAKMSQARGESMSVSHQSELKARRWKDDQLKQSYELETMQISQNGRAYDRVLKLFEEWEQQNFNVVGKIEKVAEKLNFQRGLSPEAILEGLDLLLQLQNLLLIKQQLHQEIEQITTDLRILEDKTSTLAVLFNLREVTVEEVVLTATKTLEKEQEKQARKIQYEERLSELNEEIVLLEDKISFFQKERVWLFQKARTNNEEEFLYRAKAYQESEEIKKQLNWIEKKLKVESGFKIDEKFLNDDMFLETERKELEKELEGLRIEEKDLQKQSSTVSVQLSELAQSGTYSQLRHSYEQNRSEVKEVAKKWAVLAIAKDLLLKTIEFHREVRLPQLLRKAEQYFERLTSGQYLSLYLPEHGQTFIVERKDGLRFFAEELSQATAEQLYVAIRFALSHAITQSENKLPIIIDDSFVNFDQTRTIKILSLLREMSADQQIIFFTCHKHYLSSFSAESVIFLENKDVDEQTT
ncbi:AAA family ATPase [Metabacillus herbersteinensis]|uniref:AAA family ATPase n=1 Tax=Metabacillus herbersteinensis TaxID=283816 RepID=A0ABV6GEG2_9BACI